MAGPYGTPHMPGPISIGVIHPASSIGIGKDYFRSLLSGKVFDYLCNQLIFIVL